MNINIETAVVILGEICKEFDKGCLSEGVIQEAKEFIQLHAQYSASCSMPQMPPISKEKVATDKVINRYKGAALVVAIEKCNTLNELQGYEKSIDSYSASEAYETKHFQLQNTGALCK